MKALAITLLVACGRAADHAPAVAEPPTESFTRWTATHEVFVEYPPFVAGQKSALAAHVTRLAGHQPATTGAVTAILVVKGGAPVQTTAAIPARPGIFRPELTPTTTGPCALLFVT